MDSRIDLERLIEDLRTHAYDDCGEKELPNHIANVAADVIKSLLARIEEAEKAIRLAVPVIEAERDMIADSHRNRSGPHIGKVTDRDALAVLRPMNKFLRTAAQWLQAGREGEG